MSLRSETSAGQAGSGTAGLSDTKWMKFGNNRVWQVGSDGSIEGLVMVPGYEDLDDIEARNDAVSEAVTGSIVGLMGFSVTHIGGGMVRFGGSVEELLNSEDGEEVPLPIDVHGKDFLVFLAMQYGLLNIEAEHAVSAMGDEYEQEIVIQLANGRELRSRCTDAGCDYVRICIGGLELAYWVEDEWQQAPAEVMGALIGAMMNSRERANLND
ncbi:hypothetical protein [Ottowia sp.]|uniref:hypothetical protein n=1 Tax=Ottowia sp. TaxID=1898956 RepID=UPI0025FB42E5|nr:hypothetical protein [Ottowia sp.]MBK6616673.1 hypothetical protein [Ottowia sp.]